MAQFTHAEPRRKWAFIRDERPYRQPTEAGFDRVLSWREGVPHITLGIDADPARFAVLRSAAVGWQRVRIEVVAPRRSEDTSGLDETHGIAPQ